MKKSLSLLALVAIVAVSQADVIVGFDMAGTTTDPLAANTLDANVTLNAGLARTGLGTPSSANNFGSNGWNVTDVFSPDDDYISFSLTPDEGFQLTLTDISWNRINASSTGPGNGRWGYSIGGDAWVYQTDFAITTANAAGSWDFVDVENVTEEVEFRFWAYGATSAGGGTSAGTGSVNYRNGAAGDDLVLNGSVSVVPEPSVLALLSLGGIAVLRFSRRRKE